MEITRMTEADIDGAIDCIQKAFAKDPYNLWVFDDRSKVKKSFSFSRPSPVPDMFPSFLSLVTAFL